jgi:diguanylate cyclase (GGDEF)-like protein/PAS domain S-box-containing protein
MHDTLKNSAYQDLSEAILSTLSDGIITVDIESRVLSINTAACKIFGYEEKAVLGRSLGMLMPSRYSSHGAYVKHFEEEATPRVMGEGRIIEALHASGETLFLEVGISKVFSAQKWVFVALVRDVTTRKKNEDALKYLASHDPLTGLLNRVAIEEHLRTVLMRAKRHQRLCGVLYLDLNAFKPINDRLGHAAGDAVLRTTAERLQKSCRELDRIGRMGGDEFIVVLDEIADYNAVKTVVQRLKAHCEEPIVLEHTAVSVSLAVGHACYPVDGEDSLALIHTADHRMLQEKHGLIA